ncbi:MAG: hypothetical protein ACLFV7_10495 [Phycisphaerae bacterium]
MSTCPKCSHTLPDEADRCDACGLDVAAVRIAVRQAVAELRPASCRPEKETMEYRPPRRFAWFVKASLVLGMIAMGLSAVVNFIYALRSISWPVKKWVPLLLLASAIVSVGFVMVFHLALDYYDKKQNQEDELFR